MPSLQASSPFGDIVKSRGARGTREETRSWGGGGRERRACHDLSWTFISTPGHCKAWKLSPQTCRRLEKWQPPVTFRQPRAFRIYLFISKSLAQQLSTASKQCFWPLIYIFIHWTSNFNVSTPMRTQYFDSRFVYIWKVIHIPRLSSPSQSPTL